MTWGSRSELPSLSLAVFAGVLYTLVLHVLTVVIVPSPNHWWLDRWSIPIALGGSVGVFLIARLVYRGWYLFRWLISLFALLAWLVTLSAATAWF
jgi:hypothetical protein